MITIIKIQIYLYFSLFEIIIYFVLILQFYYSQILIIDDDL